MPRFSGTRNVVILVSLVILVFLVGCSPSEESFAPPVETPEGAAYVAFEVHRNSLAITDTDYTATGDWGGALLTVGLEGRGLLYPNDLFATPLLLQSEADFHGIFYWDDDGAVIACGDRKDGPAVVRAYFGAGWLDITHSAVGNFTATHLFYLCSDEGEILRLLGEETTLDPVFQAPAGVSFNNIFCTFGTENTEVIAVGDDGAIFHRYDGGGFVDESVPGGPDFIAVSGLHSVTGPTKAIALSNHEVWELDSGIWSRVYHGPGVTLNRIRYVDSLGDVLAVGNQGVILRREGVDWNVEGLGDDVDLVASSPHPDYGTTGRVDLCGSKGEIYRGLGGLWTNLNHHATGPWSAFHTASDGRRYAANGNKLMRMGQGDWVEEAVWDWGENIFSFHVLAPDQIWALGATAGGFDRFILFYNGSVWNMIRQSSLDEFSAIWCDAAGDNVFVTAGHGQIFWHHDGIWELAVALGTADAFHAIAGSDMDNLLAVGDSGLIMRRGPGGWADESHTTTHALRAISLPLIAGDGGTILRQANGVWQDVDLEYDGRFNSVWYGGDNNIWAVGDDTGVMQYDGTEWTRLLTHLPGIDFLAITGAEDNQVWIGGTEGYLLRSPEID